MLRAHHLRKFGWCEAQVSKSSKASHCSWNIWYVFEQSFCIHSVALIDQTSRQHPDLPNTSDSAATSPPCTHVLPTDAPPVSFESKVLEKDDSNAYVWDPLVTIDSVSNGRKRGSISASRPGFGFAGRRGGLQRSRTTNADRPEIRLDSLFPTGICPSRAFHSHIM